MRTVFIILSFSLIVLFMLFAPIPGNNDTGAYNTFSGLIWCTSEKSCIHEVAHKLDDEAGWISETPEFERDVELLLGNDPDRNIKEMYAELFVMAKGREENMPELLRPYYNWSRAAELIKKYER